MTIPSFYLSLSFLLHVCRVCPVDGVTNPQVNSFKQGLACGEIGAKSVSMHRFCVGLHGKVLIDSTCGANN